MLASLAGRRSKSQSPRRNSAQPPTSAKTAREIGETEPSSTSTSCSSAEGNVCLRTERSACQEGGKGGATVADELELASPYEKHSATGSTAAHLQRRREPLRAWKQVRQCGGSAEAVRRLHPHDKTCSSSGPRSWWTTHTVTSVLLLSHASELSSNHLELLVWVLACSSPGSRSRVLLRCSRDAGCDAACAVDCSTAGSVGRSRFSHAMSGLDSHAPSLSPFSSATAPSQPSTLAASTS